MKITKDIIHDLIPLYAVNECSPDTRRVVEEYLQANPREAEELKRAMQTTIPRISAPAANLDETRALSEARRRLNRQRWIMAFAIFFSLTPLTFVDVDGRTWWFLRDAPRSALVYAALGAVCWVCYARERRHPRSL